MQIFKHILLFVFSFYLTALSVTAVADSGELTIVTDDGPPHMIKRSDSGIDIDIARDVLRLAGYETKVTYAPLGRASMMVKDKQADVVIPTFLDTDSKLFMSEPFIQYRPTVFTPANSNINLQSLDDLKGLRICTFQGATGYFGAEFSANASGPMYREMHDMSKLPSMLFKGRADVVVLDYYIFHYYAKQNIDDYNRQLVVSSAIIPEVNAYAGFHDPAVRDAFNRALLEYQAESRDLEVIESYIGNAH